MTMPFKKDFLTQQKEKLLKAREEILNTMREYQKEDFIMSQDEMVEDGDQAQAYINQGVAIGLKQRELQRLREIDLALSKIEDGTYGICEESDEPIETKRLEKQPWARLSLYYAELEEREQRKFLKFG